MSLKPPKLPPHQLRLIVRDIRFPPKSLWAITNHRLMHVWDSLEDRADRFEEHHINSLHYGDPEQLLKKVLC